MRASVPTTASALPSVSVADARATEGTGATLAFAVTLSRAATGLATLDYRTGDGTAQAGADCTATGGTLRFAPGETSATVQVPVLADAHDEGEETMTLSLSNPTGARIGDGEATGTIVNSGALPGAWLARFGRTVCRTGVAGRAGPYAAGNTGACRHGYGTPDQACVDPDRAAQRRKNGEVRVE